ncbi:hypothetical protein CO151_09595 [bacterium CG_4_9_14_3_um_filter_65_15]|nr:MAG: hypothetical protein CO151_09595 [bacterium CG_4_9_14_3_um_filter_65_15]
MEMKKFVIALLATAMLIALLPTAGLALSPYSEDFESLNQADTSALGNAGWLVFGNVFGPAWDYWYGYGVFPAPNDGAAFCAIATGEGGAAQGSQQLSIYNDYNNANHGDGSNAHIESNVFQEQVVGPADVGETWVFAFDAKLGNLVSPSTALAFIKTLDPNAGYATTNFLTMDMTGASSTWGSYSISIYIDASLVGQLMQIGFSSTASNYDPSGVFYDNLVLYRSVVVGDEDASWGEVKSLFR